MVLSSAINCPLCKEQFLIMTITHMKGFCPSCDCDIYKSTKTKKWPQAELKKGVNINETK